MSNAIDFGFPHARNSARSGQRTDREDRVLLPFWTTKDHRKRLKLLAINEERTQQELLTEALEMLFEKRNSNSENPAK